MTEWLEWHKGYEGDGPLIQRLHVVQRLIGTAIDSAPAGPIRLLSMCAGDGRDVLGVLSNHPRRNDVHARLVELEPVLVEHGRARAVEAAVDGVEFVPATRQQPPRTTAPLPPTSHSCAVSSATSPTTTSTAPSTTFRICAPPTRQ